MNCCDLLTRFCLNDAYDESLWTLNDARDESLGVFNSECTSEAKFHYVRLATCVVSDLENGKIS